MPILFVLVADLSTIMRIDSAQSSTSLQDSYNTGSDESLPETSQSSLAYSGDKLGRVPTSGSDLSATPAQSPIAPIVVPNLMDSPDSVDHIPISVRRSSIVSERSALPRGFEGLYMEEVIPSVPTVTLRGRKMVGGSKKRAAVGPRKTVVTKTPKTMVGKKGKKAAVARDAPERDSST